MSNKEVNTGTKEQVDISVINKALKSLNNDLSEMEVILDDLSGLTSEEIRTQARLHGVLFDHVRSLIN